MFTQDMQTVATLMAWEVVKSELSESRKELERKRFMLSRDEDEEAVAMIDEQIKAIDTELDSRRDIVLQLVDEVLENAAIKTSHTPATIVKG